MSPTLKLLELIDISEEKCDAMMEDIPHANGLYITLDWT